MPTIEPVFFRVCEQGALSIIQFRTTVAAATTSMGEVHAELRQFLTREECQKLVIDLSTLVYLPSSLIGVLATLSTRLDVHVTNASSDVEGVLQVMGLNKRLHVNNYTLPAEFTEAEADESPGDVPSVLLSGYDLNCVHCEQVLAIDRHSLGDSVTCSQCEKKTHVDSSVIGQATHVRCQCPSCKQEVRTTIDWINATIRCDYCHESLRVRRVL